MRIRSFEVKKVGPIKLVNVDELADVVVIAGPNGVGKTNIGNAILQLARNPIPNPNTSFMIEATDIGERSQWGKSILNSMDSGDANILKRHLQRSQRRKGYKGSFLNFDSDRAIRNVQTYNFTWNIGNLYTEDLGWDFGFSPLSNRYNDVRHSLFRLIEGQRREISDLAFKLKASGNAQMALDFTDVLMPFKEAFFQLLAPKSFVEVNVQNQQIFYEYQGQKLNFDTLSSGEKEVVNIVFDFILRNPQDCVILFDEPELHLHPELSYKLLQTLSRLGKRNQFIFSTHSPEIISASLENTVIFITPPMGDAHNQAVIVHKDDDTHHALQTLGHSIGVISLGKKLVLIEGEESSLDKQTYGAILKGRFPEFVLVPVGGKDSIRSFQEIRENILNKTIWGVSFYLLCDRDAVNLLGRETILDKEARNIKQLSRYHLENYFLDENVLALCFQEMELEGTWLRDPSQIATRLRKIGKSVVSYAVALRVSSSVREKVGKISIMPKGVDSAQKVEELTSLLKGQMDNESMRIDQGLNFDSVSEIISTEFLRLNKALDEDDPVWKSDLPGRIIFNKFSASAKIAPGRLKQLYLNKADIDITFREIIELFEEFRKNSG
jgi:predicted ATPase